MRLMTFAEENEGIVRFEPAEDFEANTPYLITFPGQTNAKIATFYGAENAYVEATTKRNFSGNLYKFTGTLSRQAASAERYMLNNDGTAFTIQPNVRVSSFRAFFKPLKEQHAQTLTIVTDETSGQTIDQPMYSIKVSSDLDKGDMLMRPCADSDRLCALRVEIEREPDPFNMLATVLSSGST